MESLTAGDESHSIVERTMGEIRELGDAKRGKAVIDLLRTALDELEAEGYIDNQKRFSSEVFSLTSGSIRHENN